MKRLILTRHAKSSWDNLDLADHDRPLNERGQKSARKIGQWFWANNYQFQSVISSTAKRCFETWQGIEAEVKSGIDPQFVKSLYHAHVGLMLELLQGAQTDCVLMLGHNPGIGGFAYELLSEPPRSQNFLAYPTGATTIIDFEINNWSDVQLRSGKLFSFVMPRELE